MDQLNLPFRTAPSGPIRLHRLLFSPPAPRPPGRRHHQKQLSRLIHRRLISYAAGGRMTFAAARARAARKRGRRGEERSGSRTRPGWRAADRQQVRPAATPAFAAAVCGPAPAHATPTPPTPTPRRTALGWRVGCAPELQHLAEPPLWLPLSGCPARSAEF